MHKSAITILLQGRVQGIGLRPAVLRWALTCGITGWITNETNGVRIHAEGNQHEVDRFRQSLQDQLPCEAHISNSIVHDAEFEELSQFTIRQQPATGPLMTEVPVDVITCELCMTEVLPGTENRRRAYAFNSCAHCGPRYSILQSMPFERIQTAMAAYRLCASCKKEFDSPEDRRFHAQTISCSNCGPAISLSDQQGKLLLWSQVALAGSTAAIMDGKIVAVKGLGGYQLICDATNEEAVATLRAGKNRPGKPLAVMVRDLTIAAQLADISGCEDALRSRAGPIVLCPARENSNLSSLIHPGLNDVGIMLPTTAFHQLLCETIRKPLVVTSGNREGEPLAYTRDQAVLQLSSLCDRMLHHDRVIHRPVDDSVVRVVAGEVVSLRLARGLSPYRLPVTIREPIVALGGQQKVALALSNGHQSILGPHLGEMDTVAAQGRFEEQYRSLCQLYGAEPRYIVHDLHPDYFTTRWAQRQTQDKIAVQHHHAHVVAGMVENGWLNETVLGIAFDGTGFGPDGTIWGGEILLATATDYQRLAYLRPFHLLGNEQAIRQPHRVALALLQEVLNRQQIAGVLQHFNQAHSYEPLLPLLEVTHLHPLTSSCGRLFDGIAALLLSLTRADYEGEPAMKLEAVCDRSENGSYPIPLIGHELDWRPLMQAILDDIQHGQKQSSIAMRFHRGLAEAIAAVIRNYPQYPVVLTGGCFQNRILVELLHELLDDKRRIGWPGMIPCNDGGMATGQLVIAAARLDCLCD